MKGEWYMLLLSAEATRKSIGLVQEVRVSDCEVLVYRKYPERFELHQIPHQRIREPAPACERLERAKELHKVREDRSAIGTLRELRKEIGCSQRELARLAGVDVHTVRNAELGRRRTHTAHMRWIFAALEKAAKKRAS